MFHSQCFRRPMRAFFSNFLSRTARIMALTIVTLWLGVPVSHAAQIVSVAVGQAGAQTEITLEFNGAFENPVLFALDAPRRIVVDFTDTQAKAGIPSAGGFGTVVSGTRLGAPNAKSTRLVIDLSEASDLVDTRTFSPDAGSTNHRFVIQLIGTTDVGYAKLRSKGKISLPGTSSGPRSDSPPQTPIPVPSTLPGTGKPITLPPIPPVAPPVTPPSITPDILPDANELSIPRPITTPLPRPPAANQIRGRIPVVTIDPGHGGHDPGAPSALKGRVEKEMALAVSLALKAELEKTGRFKVIMTRTTDVFIPFRERLAIAERAKSDLYISVHGDSVADSSIRGGTIYTLSDGRADKEADRLAAAENKADFIGGGINMGGERDEVVDILFSLVQRETRNYAAEYAEYVAREMSKVVLMRPVYRRAASLIVLTSPDIPSVLIETGYMTSKPDSEFLFSADGQNTLARSMRKSIEQYFDRRVAGK
jgi:N-acetylmuramoyl-L-alanine amidase